jgi:hypothetical protein
MPNSFSCQEENVCDISGRDFFDIFIPQYDVGNLLPFILFLWLHSVLDL